MLTVESSGSRNWSRTRSSSKSTRRRASICNCRSAASTKSSTFRTSRRFCKPRTSRSATSSPATRPVACRSTGAAFQQLTLLVPGAITPNPSSFTTPQPNTGGGRPFVNGNREQGNAFLLDGISVDETLDNLIGYKPNIDAIAEFRVETSNSSSEFGNVTGATVNATLKSGTNDWRGNVFEFIRNDKLDANSWGNNRTEGVDGCRGAEKQVAPEHLRRHAGRPDHQEQALLLHRLSGRDATHRRPRFSPRRFTSLAAGQSFRTISHSSATRHCRARSFARRRRPIRRRA